MIFTIGYQRISAKELAELAAELDATVIDVRGIPASRKPGFNRNQLQGRLGARYQWRGDQLGNKGTRMVSDAGLARLAVDGTQANVLLLCAEYEPECCHRHTIIATRLMREYGVKTVLHIIGDEVAEATDVQESIDKDTDTYPTYALSDLLDSAA